jgi:hypothetical protein
MPVADTPCAYHAGNQATVTCARCGSFLCTLCSTTLAAAVYCPRCFETMRAIGALPVLKNRFPRPHTIALGLGVLALIIPFLGALLVPVILWKCVQAVRDRESLSERETRVVPYAILAALLALSSVGMLVAMWVRR